MRGHGSASKRKGEEDAEAQDDLQFVTVATVKQEISTDTVPSPTRESRVSRQLGIDTDTGESIRAYAYSPFESVNIGQQHWNDLWTEDRHSPNSHSCDRSCLGGVVVGPVPVTLHCSAHTAISCGNSGGYAAAEHSIIATFQYLQTNI